eukprot:5207946-Karenia_brevis.AAC.1
MMTHEEWATPIPDHDQYDYDSEIVDSDPNSDTPINERTVARLEAFLRRQQRSSAYGVPGSL